MELTAMIILHELKKKYPYADCANILEGGKYSFPYIWKRGADIRPGAVYLCEDMPDDNMYLSKESLFIFASVRTAATDKIAAPCIWIGEKADIYGVLNSMQTIFQDYTDWENGLIEMERRGAGPQEFLDASVNMIGRFAFIVDSTLRIAADLLNEFDRLGIAPPPDFHREITPEAIRANRRFFCEHNQIRELVHFYADNGQRHYISMNMFDGDIFIGNLCFSNWPVDIEKRDEDILRLLVSYVRRAMIAGGNAGRSSFSRLNDTLRKMLEGSFIDRNELMIQLNNVGFRRYDIYFCAVTPIYTDMSKPYVQYLIRMLTDCIPGAVCCGQDTAVAMIINETYCLEKGFSALKQLCTAMETFGINAGVSDRFSDIFALRRFYMQACNVYDMGREKDADEILYRFDDCFEELVIKNCAGEMYPEMLWPAGFHRLLEHDNTSHISFIETLRIYLEENMNCLAAAKKLHIHRNSFIERLGRIKKLLDEDMEDPGVRFRLLLALKVWEHMKDSDYHGNVFRMHLKMDKNAQTE